MPKLPGPVLDNQRRPRVNNSETIAAVGRLGASTKTPELPDSLTAPLKALGSVGQAIAQTGDAMAGVAIEREKQIARGQQFDNDLAVEQMIGEFDEWRSANPDPTKWNPELEKRWQGYVQKFQAREDLSPRAREEIGRRLGMQGIQWAQSVRKASDRQISQKRDEAINYRVQTSIEGQMPDEFEGAMTELRDAGGSEYQIKYFRQKYAQEGERLQKKAKADQVEAAANGVTLLAKTGGAEVAIKNIRGGMFGKLDATDAENLESQARRVEATARGDIADSVLNGIIKGEVKSSARIDELTANNPLVDEQTKAKLKGFLATKDDNAIAADREQNGVKNAVALRQKAKDYDPKKDPTGEKYLSMRWEVQQRIPEGLRNSVLDTLEAKADGKTVPIAPGIKGHIDSTLDRIFDPVHGAIKWRTRATQETTEPDKDSGKPKKVFREVLSDNPTKQQEAIDRRAEIERELSPWLQANPQATPKQISEKIGELLPAGTRAQAAEALKPQASMMETKGAVTSYGYANDSTPDRNSSAGIGAFVPDEEQAKIKAGKPSDFKLRDGDLAVSQDIEAEFRKAGIKPGESVMVKLANGETRMVRWMDRTANDSQLADINAARERKGQAPIKPLRGRFDFYSPGGKSPLDGVKVVGWSKPQSLFAGN